MIEPTIPTGSRRTIDVKPGMYSAAALPGMTRPAPAKKRRQSTIAGISSFFTALIGLPQFSASSSAKACPSASMRSASFSIIAARCIGVVRDHEAKAFSAAATAASTWSGVASLILAMLLPVFGLMTGSASPLPFASFDPISISVCIFTPAPSRVCHPGRA